MVQNQEQPQAKPKKSLSVAARQWIKLHYKLLKWYKVALEDSAKAPKLNQQILQGMKTIGELKIDPSEKDEVVALLRR